MSSILYLQFDTEVKMKKKKIRLFISFLLMLFLTGGYLVTNDIVPSSWTIAGWVLLLIISALSVRKIDSNIVKSAVTMILFFVISSIYNTEPSYRTVALTVSFFTATIFAMSISFEEFKKSYSDVMFFLSAVSLFAFFFFKLFPGLAVFNVVYNTSGTPASNFFLYIVNDYDRNMGMFWEPGAFQAFVSIALLFTIMEPQFNMKRVGVFVFTIITTFSTTGYFALMIIIVLIILRWGTIGTKSKRVMKYLAIPMVALFLYASFDMLMNTSTNSVFGKLISFNEQGGLAGGTDTGSTAIRFLAITKPIEAFFQSPIFGKGYVGLQDELMMYTRGMNTCTFVNWFAMYGIIFGVLMIVGVFKFSKKVHPTRRWWIILFFFIITISENFATSAFFFTVALMGYKGEEELAKTVL